MSHSTKLYIIVIIFAVVFGLTTTAIAQEEPIMPVSNEEAAAEPAPAVVEAVNLDENIQPEALGIKEPKILPGNPFYFFKDISRGLRSALTFDPVAKAELKLKFSNERMLEVKKLAESGTRETPAKPAVLEKALSDYEKEIEGLKNVSRQIQGTAENPKVDEFLNKFLDQTFKQQKLFGKLEKDLPAEVHAKIAKARDANSAGISEIGLSLAQPEIFGEKLDKIAQEGTGGSFKNFKNLEVLKELENKVPLQAKEAIIKAQENSLKRLQSDLTAMSQEEREKFNSYLENIGGNEVQHLQVLDTLATEELPATVRQEVVKAQEKVIEKVDKRLRVYQETDLQEAKTTFFNPLTSRGEIEDMRVVKELENNLSPELAAEIIPVKETVKNNIIEKTKNPEGQKEILDKLEKKFYDVKQLEVLQEIKMGVTAETKEFYEEIKEKTIEGINEAIKGAEGKGAEAKEAVLERVAGDSPEHIKILEEAGLPSQIMPQIAKQTIKRVADKVELIAQPERMEAMKGKIEIKEVKEKIQMYQPQMFQEVDQRIEEFKTMPAPATPLPTTLPTGRQCETLITCQEGYMPYDTGERDNQGCPIKKCIKGETQTSPTSPLPTTLPPELYQFIPPTIKQVEVEAVPATPQPTPTTDNLLGGDRDEHGCIDSAGYSWCEQKQKCLRMWEEPCPSSETSPSLPSPPMVCIQVITPAIGPDNTCKQFPTPCDVPADWKKVDKCPGDLPVKITP